MSKKKHETDKLVGICGLTGVHGRYVSSHILPKALTRISRSGERRIEGGIGLPKRKRFDSWFDNELVIRSGEDILSELDNDAIRILRDHKLIWSGWNGATWCPVNDNELLGGNAYLRVLKIADSKTLQLFYLSLLWRAAASSRPEFADISLSEAEVENLRQCIVQREPGSFADYPVQLHQLITRGHDHNRVPLMEEDTFPCSDGKENITLSYVRFYFDGLVTNVYLPRGVTVEHGFLRACLGLGMNGNTLVFGQRYEDSRTHANLQAVVKAVEEQER